MTKFKKQLFIIGLLAVVLVVALVIYLPSAKKEQEDAAKVLNTPALRSVLDGDKMEITGFKKDSKYQFSSDYGTSWADVKSDKITLAANRMYCFKEVYGERSSEFAWIAPFGEASKNGRPFITKEVEHIKFVN